jgi:hypothetical protein
VTVWRILVGVVGFVPIGPHQDPAGKKDKKETTDEQTDMQSWDRKRRKMENLRMANLLSKKPKNQQTSRQTVDRFVNAGNRNSN